MKDLRKLFFKIIYLLIFALVLAPVFSVFIALPARAQTINTYEIKLDRPAEQVFNNNKNISFRKIFLNTSDQQLKNVYEIKTVYAILKLENLFASDINYIEPEQKLSSSFLNVNDPGFAAEGIGDDIQWGLLKARFPEAWNKTKGNSANTVAIIDTGIDGTHEDLSSGQVGAGYDFVNHIVISPRTDSDDNGHGTLVAGIIGATTNNFRGIAGTNWDVTLMPVKALDAKGQGNSADVAAAIVWAADNGAKVINMSLGGVGFGNDTTLSNAISYAFNKNVVLVAAAGNDVAVDGGNLDLNPVFPICDDNGSNMVIGVAATDINDQKAIFSNYGKNCVDVTAPGKRILSTINFDPATHAAAPNSYAYASGTSLAVPFVSGEAALIFAAYPKISNLEVRDRIIKSADPIDTLNPFACGAASCAGLIGSGRIDAAAALAPNLLPTTLPDGTLVKTQTSGLYYYISGAQKHLVSNFILLNRFPNITPQLTPDYLVNELPNGSDAAPIDGTIIKTPDDPTVYEILGGSKRPITFQVFQQLKIIPSQINLISVSDINSWSGSTFLPPKEGTLVRAQNNNTVFWVIDGLLHPINNNFWVQKGLSIFSLLRISDNDLKNYAQGNAYIR